VEVHVTSDLSKTVEAEVEWAVTDTDGNKFLTARKNIRAAAGSSRKPALWVWLDVEGVDARLSDNFFHLRPGIQLSVELLSEKEMSVAQLKKSLRVHSLAETYQEPV
jgi:hypothetical protein